MSQTIYKWEVYCTTTSTYQEVWSKNEPTTCPENNTHTISTSPGARITGTISNNETKIIEEDGETQAIFKMAGFKMDIPSGNIGNVTTLTHQWDDYPITLMDGWFFSSSDNVGDELNITVAENKVIGAIGAPVYIGNTEISVTGTVIDNIYKGFDSMLTDGGNVNVLGEVRDINYANSTITVTNAATNNFSPLSPTYVAMTVKVLENIYITVGDARYAFAEKKLGGKYLPAGTDLNVKYTNNSGNAKTFYYHMEYLY